MKNSENIDFKRIEQRFMVPQNEADKVLRRLKDLFSPVFYSNKSITQTIYFDNEELCVPWGTSIKARRYIKPTDQAETFNPTEKFFCEIKTEKKAGHSGREKIKFLSTLPDFGRWATEKLSDILNSQKIHPYLLIQYHRQHFILPQQNEMRVTADIAMAYGFFQKNHLVWLGHETGLRIEIKISPRMEEEPAYLLLLNLLQQHGAVMTISKKEQAHNFLGRYQDQFGDKLQKELFQTELEAKFTVESPAAYNFFLKLKKAFSEKKIAGFYIDPYPYTKASASVNFYWTRLEKGEALDGVKLLYRGGEFRIVTKAQTRIIKDHYGLNCLMIRREEKGERFKHSRENLQRVLAEHTEKFGALTPRGCLLRSRLAIWPENLKTGRIYHLSLDRCAQNGRVFYQLEIEYVGKKATYDPTPTDPLNEIISELAALSHEVCCFTENEETKLRPSQLTKLEWLTG